MWVGRPSKGIGAAEAAPHRRPIGLLCDERKKCRCCWRHVRLYTGFQTRLPMRGSGSSISAAGFKCQR